MYKTLLIRINQEWIVFLRIFTSQISFLRSRGAIWRVSGVGQSFLSGQLLKLHADCANCAQNGKILCRILLPLNSFTCMWFFCEYFLMFVEINPFFSCGEFSKINTWIGSGKNHKFLQLIVEEYHEFCQRSQKQIAVFFNQVLKKS